MVDEEGGGLGVERTEFRLVAVVGPREAFRMGDSSSSSSSSASSFAKTEKGLGVSKEADVGELERQCFLELLGPGL